jgi:acetyl esterase/lipase
MHALPAHPSSLRLAKKIRLFLRFALISILLVPMSHAADIPREIPLWPEGVPGIKADTSNESVQNGIYIHTHHPELIYYPPKPGTANGTAVIFAPGGGYVRINIGGGSFFQWLTDNGVAVYVLIYRNQDYGQPAPLQDVLRAVRILRSRAADYGIKPDRIGILGNSAGSHVAASAGTLFNDPAGKTGAPLDAVSGRPDFLILTFPVISMEQPYAHMPSRNALLGLNPSPDVVAHWSLEKQVTKDTPPTFLVHTMEDRVVPVENTILFYEALRQAGVPVEMHLYEKGPHGSGLSPDLYPTNEWPQRAQEWMTAHGWLPAPAASNSP